MARVEIKNLQELLGKYIGEDETVTGADTSRLTAPGENYCSLILKVDINLKKKNGSSDVLQTVGKFLLNEGPFKDSPMAQETFKSEVAFYSIIAPTLQEFQREYGVRPEVDLFPKMYGARENLKENSDIVDEDAALILEYLAGYSNVDRTIGYDLETAKLVLKNLAIFHAVPLALKLKKPEVFEKNIKPYCNTMPPPPPPDKEKKDHPRPNLVALEFFEKYYKSSPLMPKLRKALQNVHFGFNNTSAREPFSTLAHSDMWMNNCMIRFKDGKPVQCKFVDFQMYNYRSPAHDLFFFLWTSIKKSVIEESLDDLIKCYHEQFLNTLEVFGCNTIPFSLDKFMEEIRIASERELEHAVTFLLFVVLGKKRGFDEEVALTEPDFSAENISEEAKERAWYIVQACDNRGWL